MKSKSFKLSSARPENAKLNKTFDFVNYYKTAADSNTSIKKDSRVSNNKDPSEASHTPMRRRNDTKKFKGEIMNVTKIDIDGQHLIPDSGRRSFLNDSKLTSTPNVSKNKNAGIKSIMKGTSELDNSLDMDNVPQINRKKRNKSVSFMLEENEEVIIKKTKSDFSLESKFLEKNRQKLKKNNTKNQQKEDKENNVLKNKTNNAENDSNKTECTTVSKNSLKKNKKPKPNTKTYDDPIVKEVRGDNINLSGDNSKSINSARIKKTNSNIDIPIPNIQKKKRKCGKRNINIDKTESVETACDKDDKINVEFIQVIKNNQKKSGKNKHKVEVSEIGEPAKKAIKKNKPDAIAEEIQKLNIGDNAHTLTNLLNGMNVNKNKKLKTKKISNPELKPEHKIKSKKNNKKRKNRNLNAVVLVQNLPFKVLLGYKQLLKNWFSKYGTVHSVGIADLKCNKDEAKPIFTTRIFFKREEEATLAQAEDKALFEGNIIRVKKYAPPEERLLKLDSSSERAERHKSEEATSDISANVIEESDSDE